MRERENPMDEARARRDEAMWEDSERKLEDTESSRTDFYMPHSPVPGKVPQRSDSEIARDIESALFYDQRVKSYEVQCEVKRGRVILSGTVEDETSRRMAEERVRAVHGIKGITNNLRVRS